MPTKRWVALMSAAALALMLAVPSLANAARLEQPAGKLAPIGTMISATATQFRGVFGYENYSCGPFVPVSKLTRNNGSVVETTVSSDLNTRCELGAGGGRNMTHIHLNFRLEEPFSSTVNLSFEVELPPGAGWVCHYEAPVKATYETGSSVVRVQAVYMESTTGGICNPGYIRLAEFNLSNTANGQPFVLN